MDPDWKQSGLSRGASDGVWVWYGQCPTGYDLRPNSVRRRPALVRTVPDIERQWSGRWGGEWARLRAAKKSEEEGWLVVSTLRMF